MNVFLSYSHTDAPLAARVSRGLKAAGLNVWSPDGDLLPGDNLSGMEQRSLAEAEHDAKGRRTRRERFPERMDGLIPWDRLTAPIEPH